MRVEGENKLQRQSRIAYMALSRGRNFSFDLFLPARAEEPTHLRKIRRLIGEGKAQIVSLSQDEGLGQKIRVSNQ